MEPKRTKVSRERGQQVKLMRGPFDGQVALLSCTARNETACFTAKGQTGRYVREGLGTSAWQPQGVIA